MYLVIPSPRTLTTGASQLINAKLTFAAQQITIEGKGLLNDDELCALVRKHLTVELSPFLVPSQQQGLQNGKKLTPTGRGGESQQAIASLSLEEFVAATLPLVELERNAEVTQVSSPIFFPCRCSAEPLADLSYLEP